jgi:hypothetical protein
MLISGRDSKNIQKYLSNKLLKNLYDESDNPL